MVYDGSRGSDGQWLHSVEYCETVLLNLSRKRKTLCSDILLSLEFQLFKVLIYMMIYLNI